MNRPATLASIRFGTGLHPDRPALDAAAPLDSLAQEAMPAFRIEPWPDRLERHRIRDHLRRTARDSDDMLEADRALTRASLRDLRATLAGMVAAPVGFHARLTWFWANHFATEGRRPTLARSRAAYIEDAIRPHVTGRFADLLRAAVLHPVMLVYLDQHRSVGPNSPAGGRRGRGLNENLAREVLELHTLGAQGSYTQADVTEFARLLTGVTVSLEAGMIFDANLAEPAMVTLLGQRFGARVRTLPQVTEALDMLARHPDTAQHVATQLATHFVSDAPEPALVAHVAGAFRASDGDLMAVYAAMLDHPAAWAPPLAKVRPPMLWMAAAARALGIPPQVIMDLSGPDTRRLLMGPMAQMGEGWEAVPSPAGHGLEGRYWISSQRLAARVTWAMALAQEWPGPRDPAAFLDAALADAASEPLRRAAMGAESRAQAIGVILSSPDFNRC
ncbi:MAG: DUF1800 family protein [Roseinatronobacter sp.]